jgi:hypothetical protein
LVAQQLLEERNQQGMGWRWAEAEVGEGGGGGENRKSTRLVGSSRKREGKAAYRKGLENNNGSPAAMLLMGMNYCFRFMLQRSRNAKFNYCPQMTKGGSGEFKQSKFLSYVRTYNRELGMFTF